MTGDIDFECTQCGRCCHDLKLPLTVQEAVAWLKGGHEVQLLCEAVPWPVEPQAADLQAQHKRRRSFAAMSGSMPTRVVVILAASFDGACPHLKADQRCGIYQRRPLVCRIYPAEISPFIALTPASKACPRDAWNDGRPPLLRGGVLVNAEARDCIARSKHADEAEVHIKSTLCALLSCDAAALANEGFVVHSPGRALLLDALKSASAPGRPPLHVANWRLMSNQRATLDELAEIGASPAAAEGFDTPGAGYLGFSAASAQTPLINSIA